MEPEDINRYKDLMKLAKELPIKERRHTFFDIAGRGHYENPLSDLLRFFLDPNECHGLGTSILAAFCQACGLGEDWVSPSAIVQREYRTTEDKRLDIAIVFPDRAILVEAKIYHTQVNPFGAYEEAISTDFQIPRNMLQKFVLSPYGNAATLASASGWSGLGFIDVAKHFRTALSAHQLSKWRVLCEELATHLINLGEAPSMDDKIIKFVEENLADIKALEQMKATYLKYLQGELLSTFQEITNDGKATTRTPPWGPEFGTVITVHPSDWGIGAQAGFTPTWADDNTQCGAIIWAAKDLPTQTAKAVSLEMTRLGADCGMEGKRPVWSKYGCKTIHEGHEAFRSMVELYHRIAVIGDNAELANSSS